MRRRDLIINTALCILLKEQRIQATKLHQQLLQADPEARFTQPDITRAKLFNYYDLTLINRRQRLGDEKAERMKQALLKILDVEVQEEGGACYLASKKTSQKWELLSPQDSAVSEPKGLSISNKVAANVAEFEPILDMDELLKKIKTCKGEIEILQSYLSRTDSFIDAFEANLKNSSTSTISILLLDPNHEAAHLRAKGIKSSRPHEDVLHNLANNIQKLRVLEEKYPQRFSILTYNALPGAVCYRVGSTLFVGFHFMGKYSREGTYIKLDYNESHPFVKNLKEHWEKVKSYAEDFNNIDRFTIRFRCHLLHDGKLKSMKLLIDAKTNDAMLTGTPSKSQYIGSITSMGRGYCHLHLPEKNITSDGRTRGIVSFVLNLNIMQISTNCPQLSTGIFTVNSPTNLDTMYARAVLVEQEKSSFPSTRKKDIINMFFSNAHDVELANRYGSINTWEALESQLYVNNRKN